MSLDPVGRPCGGGQDQVRRFGEVDPAGLLHHAAGGAVRHVHVTREDADEGARRIHDRGYGHVRLAHGRFFKHLFRHRVPVQESGVRPGVHAVFGWVQGEPMIVRNGFPGGQSRNQRFAAAAETGVVVVRGRAEEHEAAGLDGVTVHPDRVAPAAGPDGHEIRVVVRVMEEDPSLQAPVQVGAKQCRELIACRMTVDPRCHQKEDILRGASFPVQLAQDRGQDAVRRRAPRVIGDHDTGAFPGCGDIEQ